MYFTYKYFFFQKVVLITDLKIVIFSIISGTREIVKNTPNVRKIYLFRKSRAAITNSALQSFKRRVLDLDKWSSQFHGT
jgi:hypothetical protein